jgi:hypothetical protein
MKGKLKYSTSENYDIFTELGETDDWKWVDTNLYFWKKKMYSLSLRSDLYDKICENKYSWVLAAFQYPHNRHKTQHLRY